MIYSVCLETETKVTSAIFHLEYFAKLISQGQVFPILATANGNAWSFFPVRSREILPCNSWFLLAGQRIPKWKKKQLWTMTATSRYGICPRPWKPCQDLSKRKKEERQGGRGRAILCNVSPPVWYVATVARVKSVKDDYMTASFALTAKMNLPLS